MNDKGKLFFNASLELGPLHLFCCRILLETEREGNRRKPQVSSSTCDQCTFSNSAWAMEAAECFLRLLTPATLVLETIKGHTSTSSFHSRYRVGLQETSTVSNDHHHEFEC